MTSQKEQLTLELKEMELKEMEMKEMEMKEMEVLVEEKVRKLEEKVTSLEKKLDADLQKSQMKTLIKQLVTTLGISERVIQSCNVIFTFFDHIPVSKVVEWCKELMTLLSLWVF